MKTIVFAYHDMGCAGIEALLKAGFDICAIFTHPDRASENHFFGSVARLAAEQGIPVFAPDDVNHALWVERIQKMAPDMIFSFYYRALLSEKILATARLGAYNLHGSLLPTYRGRAPLNWVLVNGESETGVTLHRMVARADAGDILAQERIAIADDDDAMSLHQKLVAGAKTLLASCLPTMKQGLIDGVKQDESRASVMPGRTPEDGRIEWSLPAKSIANLVRAVTDPWPGAFGYVGTTKFIVWKAKAHDIVHTAKPGTALSINPLIIACGEGALEVLTGQSEQGVYMNGSQLAQSLGLVEGALLYSQPMAAIKRRKRVLILGVNGFIGNHLTERLLQDENFDVYGLDISIHSEWIQYHIKKCDVILPLVAIATPIEYTRNPLRVFELDFEENLKIIRDCVKYQKRIIFPSTSEVYGMCHDSNFDEDRSNLVVGPINKQRWIYSVSKQLLDRVIWAYGEKEGLKFTLFRPFNWMGPRLDNLNAARIGSSRAITQLILNLVEGSPIKLIDGGAQKRCFTDIQDGVEALFRIIEDKHNHCNGQIINIGNPDNEASIKELAERLLAHFERHPLRDQFPPFAGFREVESSSYYGKGYQDVEHRKPSIKNARRLLDWTPVVNMDITIENTLDFFLRSVEPQDDVR